ncbi:hypothetical protein DFH08DRAFT_1039844 [Mycena albidolilacea]|uniref:Metallophosphoesterase domain-containing protein 1 n=1 Tax=Mycena albidolilacea TaxID=1033008 RepID=A0AAD6ZBQ7_9AGAR|nr:hypothetical protein DFH08DRAFT_1039844 [Mycena albidolilacea]
MHVTTSNEESSRATTISPSTASGIPAIGKVGRVAGPLSAEAILDLLKEPRAIVAGVVYLQDEKYTFRVHEGGKEWSVHGSPDVEAFVSRVPQTDILLTHSPPHHILDLNGAMPPTPSGCPVLAACLLTGALRPRLHVFGHIHEARGAYVHVWGQEGDHDLGAQNASQLHVHGILQEDGVKSERVPPVETLSAGDHGQTVFVNAANSPPRGGRKVPAGEPGVEPVVVDLLEEGE